MENDVQLLQWDFRDGVIGQPAEQPVGTIICNPPYGERMGSQAEVAQLYQAMPEIFGQLPGWSVGVLTSHPRFEKLVERQGRPESQAVQRPDRVPVLSVCGWRVRATRGRGTSAGEARNVRSDEQASARAVATSPQEQDQKTREQAELFRTRLLKRANHLRRWAKHRNRVLPTVRSRCA